ncbi:MAG: glycoside hydrolase family 2 protein [Bacteroidales bacterium]|nr:glycoside hydrolase family 2 protein [Bacteroidales bacterium]
MKLLYIFNGTPSLLLFAGFCILYSCTSPSEITIRLDTGWMFREAGAENAYPATVPGCVHTDLMAALLIPDPFFGCNEKDVQWVERKSWEYFTEFEMDDHFPGHDWIDLCFEGLDTHARVYLNDSLVLEAGNMFREWHIASKDILVRGKNTLRVVFESAVIYDSLSAMKAAVRYPDDLAFSRKAPYHYGWDWGPRLVTSGIWKPVFVEGWKTLKLDDVQVFTIQTLDKTASMKAQLTVLASENTECSIRIMDNKSGKTYYQGKTDLQKGENTIPVLFDIDDPKLWWTNGLGDPHLYELEISAGALNRKSSKTVRTGIRSLELVQEPDSVGRSFFFRLNGKPVFMKGANYIPQDNFPARVSAENYRLTIESAKSANMNMLRVWGGGIYENDIFYDLCDENGILIWQDFMFACNLYPGDEPFLENVKQEAINNILRLRNHPSLAVWCGNNEVDEGWHNWGWQKQLNYSAEDSTAVWQDYLDIFEALLPGLVSEYDPGRPYWPSSPMTGWGHESAMLEGDMHYWGVWWGAEPFEVYENKVGRFMSEYGFQAFPSGFTLDKMLNPEDRRPGSEALLAHQKHPRGMQLIQEYMEREYRVPGDFNQYAYVSRLVQAYGITKAVEAHRRAMPVCMGTLYWQLNDCWPVISWSGMDYYGQWKALHYFIRKAYSQVILSFEKKGDIISLYYVSDKTAETDAELKWQMMGFSGNIISEGGSVLTLEALTSGKIESWNMAEMTDPGSTLLYAYLLQGGEVVAEKIHYFDLPKNLKLPDAEVKMNIRQSENVCLIELWSENLAKNVFLEPTETDGFLSDNYFDLLPGKTKIIRFVSGGNKCPEINSFRIMTLNDTY